MRSRLAGTTALLAAGVIAACGGSDEPNTTTAAQTGPCSEIEEVDVPAFGTHVETDLSAADYDTNPPTGGDHDPNPLQAAAFYTEPPPLDQAVHLLEHGAVIGWTNELPRQDLKAVQKAFNDVFKDGYYQLAVVENPELEVPFALSAWGALQTCDEVQTSVIRPFVEEWYASSKSAESFRACDGQARRLPAC